MKCFLNTCRTAFNAILFCCCVFGISCTTDGRTILKIVNNEKIADKKSDTKSDTKYISQERIDDLNKFLKNKKYNKSTAVFIDFKIPSNKYRFFIYDLKNDEILDKGLVAHGSGSVIPGSSELKFSNIENSYQSSLGKYEIANSYVGDFDKSYRLKGLDKTNSLAMQRAIVLHPYSCIQNEEQENLSCLSWGCPMVSQNFFNVIAKYVDSSKDPVIMYCYY